MVEVVEKPKQQKINYLRIVRAAQELLDEYDDYQVDRVAKADAYLVEEVLQAVFGHDVFHWINERTE